MPKKNAATNHLQELGLPGRIPEALDDDGCESSNSSRGKRSKELNENKGVNWPSQHRNDISYA